MQIFPPKPEPQSLEAVQKVDADGDDTMTTAEAASTDVPGSASEAEKKWTQDFVQQVGIA